MIKVCKVILRHLTIFFDRINVDAGSSGDLKNPDGTCNQFVYSVILK